MREFDEFCLTPVAEIPAHSIKALREREQVSQPVFAAYLNVSRNLVSGGQEAGWASAAFAEYYS